MGFTQTVNDNFPADDCAMPGGNIGLWINNSAIPFAVGTNVDFTFDNIFNYFSGKTIAGAVQLKVNVEDFAPPTGNCIWGLKMIINNLPQVNVLKWNEEVTYDPTPPVVQVEPNINMLWVRVTNSCQTPKNDDFEQCGPSIATEIQIIDDIVALAANPVACDGTQINAPGSFMSNYGMYTFNIDFKIQPGLTGNYIPGKWSLILKFQLYEH